MHHSVWTAARRLDAERASKQVSCARHQRHESRLGIDISKVVAWCWFILRCVVRLLQRRRSGHALGGIRRAGLNRFPLRLIKATVKRHQAGQDSTIA